MRVFKPEAQTLLTLVTGTVMGIPAPKEAYLPGDYPKPAAQTFPNKTSSTTSGEIYPAYKAPVMAADPNSVAFTLDNFPKKDPMGVLLPATI